MQDVDGVFGHPFAIEPEFAFGIVDAPGVQETWARVYFWVAVFHRRVPDVLRWHDAVIDLFADIVEFGGVFRWISGEEELLDAQRQLNAGFIGETTGPIGKGVDFAELELLVDAELFGFIGESHAAHRSGPIEEDDLIFGDDRFQHFHKGIDGETRDRQHDDLRILDSFGDVGGHTIQRHEDFFGWVFVWFLQEDPALFLDGLKILGKLWQFVQGGVNATFFDLCCSCHAAITCA